METKHREKSNEITELKQELDTLRKSLEEGVKKYNSLLINKDRYYNDQLMKLEERYKNSWKWRIGNFFVENFILFVNFLKNPVRFVTSVDYRRTWNIHNSHSQIINPGPTIQPVPVNPFNNSENQSSLTSIPKKNKPVPEIKPISLTQFTAPVQIPSSIVHEGNKPVLATIFDEFTSACFSPECSMISFRPDNWKEKIEQQRPDVVFVESAWHGNQGSWQYKIAKYSRNMGDELNELVLWAKTNHIPTVFWNKEDPPNFDRFIDKASLFDTIFTSDEDCIPKYRTFVKHDRIFSLPFAAQPLIHNPIGEEPRSHNVCFAGTYHADEYFERQNDMEIILNPSLENGLHIYDRNFGAVGPGSERFRFPEKYQSVIKGRLNYQEMIRAYHQYRVFLNVNSVKSSPTMFSRRVFELLASGTPVISTYSKGINKLLGDTVFITESESDTRKHLDLLLNDKIAWMKASVAGIRKVMESHTYDHRLNLVFNQIGLGCKPVYLPEISLLIRTENEEGLVMLTEVVKKQTLKPKSVILISECPIANEKFEHFSNLLNPIRALNLVYFQDKLTQKISELAPSGYYAIWDQKDSYGPNYLKDYALAMKYSGSAFFGKSNYMECENGKIIELRAGRDFKWVNSVPVGTLMFKSDKLSGFNLGLMNKPNGVYDSFLPEILSLDPMNYVKNSNNRNDVNIKIVESIFV